MPINAFLYDTLILTIEDLPFTAFLFYNFAFLIYLCYSVLLRTKPLLTTSYIFYIYFSLKLPVLAAAPDNSSCLIFPPFLVITCFLVVYSIFFYSSYPRKYTIHAPIHLLFKYYYISRIFFIIFSSITTILFYNCSPGNT